MISSPWSRLSSDDARGLAWVFVRNGDEWTQQATLQPPAGEPDNAFGSGVAISGNTVVVGTALESSNTTGVNGDGDNKLAEDSGAAYAFTLSEISDADTTAPVVTAPHDIFEFATGDFTMVDLGTATAKDDSGQFESIVNDWPGGGLPDLPDSHLHAIMGSQ